MKLDPGTLVAGSYLRKDKQFFHWMESEQVKAWSIRGLHKRKTCLREINTELDRFGTPGSIPEVRHTWMF